MRFRRPELVPSVFFIASFVTLCSLGSWQMQRLAWKTDIISKTAEAAKLPPITRLPDDISALTYHPAKLPGRFHHDKAMHLIGRQQGMDVGYYIITPFALEKDGRVILVDRGFSPLGKESKPDGIQTIEGIFRPLREKRFFAPTNMPERNIWSYEDIAEIKTFSGLEPLPLVLEATGKYERDSYPIPNEGKFIFRNDHLGYAITWYGLAIVSVIMFGAYYRKKQ